MVIKLQRALPLRALLVVLLAAASAPAARGDYKESYKDGMKAVDRKAWADAIELMSRAAGERNREGGEKVNLYGMRFEHYLPHYYLGVAYFESGQLDAAESEWNISQEQGVVQSTPQNRELQKYLRELVDKKEEARRRALARAFDEAQKAIDDAAGSLAEVERLRQDATSGQVFREDDALVSGHRQALDDLESARDSLRQARGAEDVARANAAAETARQAGSRLSGLSQTISRKTAALLRQRAEALARAVSAAEAEIAAAARVEAEARSLGQDEIGATVLRQSPGLADRQQRAGGVLANARRELDDGQGREEVARVEEARQLASQARSQLEELVDEVRQGTQALRAERAAQAAAALEQAVREAESALDSAGNAGTALDQLRRDDAATQALSDDPALERERQQAVGLLQSARQTLEAGRRDQAADQVVAAEDLAGQARRALDEVSRKLTVRAEAVRAEAARRAEEERIARLEAERRQELERELRTLRGEAGDLVTRIDRRRQPSDALDRSKAGLQDLNAAAAPGPDLSIEELERRRARYASSIAVARELLAQPETPEPTAAPRPPAELVASARAYFTADYRQALAILAGATFPDERSALQAHLFRAAAQHALYHQVGGQEASRLKEARREIEACRRIDASFRPDPEAFAPRFITFFEQGP